MQFGAIMKKMHHNFVTPLHGTTWNKFFYGNPKDNFCTIHTTTVLGYTTF